MAQTQHSQDENKHFTSLLQSGRSRAVVSRHMVTDIIWQVNMVCFYDEDWLDMPAAMCSSLMSYGVALFLVMFGIVGIENQTKLLRRMLCVDKL